MDLAAGQKAVVRLILLGVAFVAAPAVAYLLTRWQKQREQYRPETWTRNNLHFVLTGERRWEE